MKKERFSVMGHKERGTEQTRYKAGLVGAGYISEYHIAGLRRLPNVEIVGLCDVDLSRAKLTAEKFGIKAFSSMEALKEAGAEVLHILTPPHTHTAVALQALELGCHALIEKPLAVEVGDCEKIQALADRKGLRVCVNHSLLFDPQVQRALKTVREGRLGRVVSVDILRSSAYPAYPGGPLPPQYRTAGYPFRDLGIHALYLFEAFLGPIEDVHAEWASLGGDLNLAYDEWRAQVRCKGGLGQFQLSWNVKPIQHQIIVQGTKGVLRVDLFLASQAIRSSTPLPKAAERVLNSLTDSVPGLVDLPRNILGFLRGKVLPYHGLQDLIREFYRALDQESPMPVSASDAVSTVRWTEEIARKADAQHTDRIQHLPLSESVPIVITGASGGLGNAVVERLRSEGAKVRLFQRRVPETLPEGVEVAIGNLGDPDAVDRAIRGAEVVLHIGAAMKGGDVDHQCATVVGTKNVLEACRKHGIEKFVHISSLSVVDWAGAKADDPISEFSPLEPRAGERGAYTQAKLEAERLVMEYAQNYGIPAVILRPGQIFGGKIPLLTPAVARRSAGRWIVLGEGRLPLPLVYIDDVVDAIALALKSDFHSGEIFQIVDPESFTQNEVLGMVLGERAGITHLPRGLVFLAGKLSEIALGMLGRKSPLAVYRLRSALARRQFRSEKAGLLGWKPRVGVREGIRRATEGEAAGSLTWSPRRDSPTSDPLRNARSHALRR
jgi:predicted dehydrogenase/nucleoside-diphosphate-sugar epimerase